MSYYRPPVKRKRKSVIGFIFGIIGMTIFGVIREQTNDTLR